MIAAALFFMASALWDNKSEKIAMLMYVIGLMMIGSAIDNYFHFVHVGK